MKFLIVLLLLILGACALNADQEASLNNAMVSFVNSKNNGAVMSYVAFTHPNAVAFYKEKGDSIFKARFDLSNAENDAFLQDGNIREIQHDKSKIHVKYSFLSVESDIYENKATEVIIFAISEDKGNSWFFIDERDYTNNDIIESTNRLIK